MGDFLEKLWQFSWRRSKMDCLLKKGVPNIATFDKWQCKVHRFWNRNNFEMEMILKWKWSWNGFEFFMASSLTYFQLMLLYYTPWKHHKTFGFLVFSGGTEWEIGQKCINLTFFSKLCKMKLLLLPSICLFVCFYHYFKLEKIAL